MKNFGQTEPGIEILSERDIKLNELSRKLEGIVDGIKRDSVFLIKMADKESPDEHAEVDTDSLGGLKLKIKSLEDLIREVEEVYGIIEGEK